MLLTLPGELQLLVVQQLGAQDIATLSSTCTELRSLCLPETVWIHLAERQFKVKLKVTEEFSPRLFFQSVLYPYRHTLGLWQRKNLRYYGGVLQVSVRDTYILFEEIIPPIKLSDPLKRLEFLRLSRMKQDDDVVITSYSKLALTDRVKVSYEEDEEEPKLSIILANIEDHTLNPDEWREIMLEFVMLAGGNEADVNNLLLMKFIQTYHARSLYTYRKLSFDSTPTTLLTALNSGIFIGNYGPHGMEVINLTVTEAIVGTAGVKVTGDPNVPYGEVTFRITDPRCLNVPLEDQESIPNITSFMDSPDFIDFQEGLKLDFKVPADCFEKDEVQFRHCLGRWVCECQVAEHGYLDPFFIPGNFVLFSEDMFGVLFLRLGVLTVYKRVTNQLTDVS